MTPKHHDPIQPGSPIPSRLNLPFQQLDQALENLRDGSLPFIAPDIDGGTIDGATIGETVPADATFTTLTASADTILGFGGAFRAYQNAPVTSQTVADQTTTLIELNSVEFDTDGNFDTTLFRYKPNAAGKYWLSAQISLTALPAGKTLQMFLYKNGSMVVEVRYQESSGGLSSGNIAALMDADGVDDYFEIRVYHNAGSALIVDDDPQKTWFAGARIA